MFFENKYFENFLEVFLNYCCFKLLKTSVMKNFTCEMTGFHSGTLLNKVFIIDVFLGIIRPFERQLFVRAVAKIQVFILQSVFHQAKVKNKNVE